MFAVKCLTRTLWQLLEPPNNGRVYLRKKVLHIYSPYKRIMRRLHFDFQIGWSIGNNGPNPTNPLVVPVAFLTLIKRLNNFSNSSAIVTVYVWVCVYVCVCVFCIWNCCRFFTVQIRLKSRSRRGQMEKYGKIANNWAVNNVGCQGSNSFECSSTRTAVRVHY